MELWSREKCHWGQESHELAVPRGGFSVPWRSHGGPMAVQLSGCASLGGAHSSRGYDCARQSSSPPWWVCRFSMCSSLVAEAQDPGGGTHLARAPRTAGRAQGSARLWAPRLSVWKSTWLRQVAPGKGPAPGSSHERPNRHTSDRAPAREQPSLGVSSSAGSNLPGAAPPPRVSRFTDRQVTLWTWGCQDPDKVLMSKSKQSCRPLTSHWQVERLRQRERQPVPSGLRQPSAQPLQLALWVSSRAQARPQPESHTRSPHGVNPEMANGPSQPLKAWT